ncbi:MAG: endonuclease III [Puniceicoccales bacterium]|nr:endonuclease III [Puniceicoccales bacterium]
MASAELAVVDVHLRAAVVADLLKKFFPKVPQFLHGGSPFQLLVAVVLSARCTDRQVERITPGLFAQAPTPDAMLQLPLDRLEHLIHSAGFFRQKARALHDLSLRLVQDFASSVPLNFSDLESLPGVGHKTASVVLGLCTDLPTFPVDTHVARLAVRWKLAGPWSVEKIEKNLKKLFPKKEWGNIHGRMIAYGRTECTARGCDGSRCRICQRLQKL